MRYLRQAIPKVDRHFAELRDQLKERGLLSDEARETLYAAHNELMSELDILWDKARTHLLVCGLEIPLGNRLTQDIIACPNCHDTLCDYSPNMATSMVTHEELLGVIEGAQLECCEYHTNQIVRYGEDERRALGILAERQAGAREVL